MAASFYAAAAPAVQAATKGTVLFPSVVLAQMALESRLGKSRLSAEYHNFFGHKASSKWKGRKVSFATPNDAKKVSQFRVYGSNTEGIRAHVAILSGPLYRRAQAAGDPYAQVRALAATYAEDRSYADKLVAIMQQQNLTQYDAHQTGPGLLALALLGTAAAYHYRTQLTRTAARFTRLLTTR